MYKSELEFQYYRMVKSSGAIPHITVTNTPPLIFPQDYFIDGKVCINIGPVAVKDIKFGMEELTFKASYENQPYCLQIPYGNIELIYPIYPQLENDV